MIDADEFATWLQLLEAPGLGRDAARRLLAAFGSPAAVLQASTAARCKVVSPAVAQALERVPEGFASRLQAATAWLATRAQAPRAMFDHLYARLPVALDPQLAALQRHAGGTDAHG